MLCTAKSAPVPAGRRKAKPVPNGRRLNAEDWEGERLKMCQGGCVNTFVFTEASHKVLDCSWHYCNFMSSGFIAARFKKLKSQA